MEQQADPQLTKALIELGVSSGLAAVGVCRAEPYRRALAAIEERSQAGLFADLRFTMAQPEVSCHPERLLDGARSVVSAALSYWYPDTEPAAAPPHGTVARFARWDPYPALAERLERLAALLSERGFESRVLVDDNAHVDREAAALAGVGFHGKNTNIITRTHGSWVVLGTLATTAPLVPSDPVREGCGSCRLCIDACPTDAILDGRVLDVGRCLTYWTQSRHVVPDDIADALGSRVYGCDICQDVCPWNRGTESRRQNEAPMHGSVSLADWLAASDAELNQRYRRFFVPRRRMAYLRRNALIALGNRGTPEDAPLAAAFLDHDEPSIAAAARRALERIGGPVARAALNAHGMDR